MIFEVSQSEAHVTFHWELNWIRQVLPASLYEEFGHNPALSGHAKLIIYSSPNPLSTFSIYAASLSRLS